MMSCDGGFLRQAVMEVVSLLYTSRDVCLYSHRWSRTFRLNLTLGNDIIPDLAISILYQCYKPE